MYSFPNLEPVRTVASWPAYRLLRKQIRWSGIPISLRISTVCCELYSQRLWCGQQSRSRCFSGTLLLFLWSNRCWQFDLWSLCIFSRLNTCKFSVHVLLKPGLNNFEHYFVSMWDEYNCAVVWAFFGIAFLWDWNENWPFPVLWPLLSFPNLLAYWVQHFHTIIF